MTRKAKPRRQGKQQLNTWMKRRLVDRKPMAHGLRQGVGNPSTPSAAFGYVSRLTERTERFSLAVTGRVRISSPGLSATLKSTALEASDGSVPATPYAWKEAEFVIARPYQANTGGGRAATESSGSGIDSSIRTRRMADIFRTLNERRMAGGTAGLESKEAVRPQSIGKVEQLHEDDRGGSPQLAGNRMPRQRIARRIVEVPQGSTGRDIMGSDQLQVPGGTGPVPTPGRTHTGPSERSETVERNEPLVAGRSPGEENHVAVNDTYLSLPTADKTASAAKTDIKHTTVEARPIGMGTPEESSRSEPGARMNESPTKQTARGSTKRAAHRQLRQNDPGSTARPAEGNTVEPHNAGARQILQRRASDKVAKTPARSKKSTHATPRPGAEGPIETTNPIKDNAGIIDSGQAQREVSPGVLDTQVSADAPASVSPDAILRRQETNEPRIVGKQDGLASRPRSLAPEPAISINRAPLPLSSQHPVVARPKPHLSTELKKMSRAVDPSQERSSRALPEDRQDHVSAQSGMSLLRQVNLDAPSIVDVDSVESDTGESIQQGRQSPQEDSGFGEVSTRLYVDDRAEDAIAMETLSGANISPIDAPGPVIVQHIQTHRDQNVLERDDALYPGSIARTASGRSLMMPHPRTVSAISPRQSISDTIVSRLTRSPGLEPKRSIGTQPSDVVARRPARQDSDFKTFLGVESARIPSLEMVVASPPRVRQLSGASSSGGVFRSPSSPASASSEPFQRTPETRAARVKEASPAPTSAPPTQPPATSTAQTTAAGERPALDLKALAREVYPLLRRMVIVEKERLPL